MSDGDDHHMSRVERKHVENNQEIVITVDDFGDDLRITLNDGTKDARNLSSLFSFDVS
jgi:hypothetical protein